MASWGQSTGGRLQGLPLPDWVAVARQESESQQKQSMTNFSHSHKDRVLEFVRSDGWLSAPAFSPMLEESSLVYVTYVEVTANTCGLQQSLCISELQQIFSRIVCGKFTSSCLSPMKRLFRQSDLTCLIPAVWTYQFTCWVLNRDFFFRNQCAIHQVTSDP
ncbi:hypothetical protein CEXT_335241 [Caerostris extrusa]|uniref:Uncharacterized protein n=1 Tax=Caerostris extrusa TaxID=172846 RepID=A0AAV4NLZ3_CAEEX|nr:hypothetical protein CEXT_335241 [Caerostris extrusa]